MFGILQKYYQKFTNVRTVYYAYSNAIEQDFVLSDMILFIKGIEVYGTQITEKTIKAFEFFQNEYY